MTTVLSKKELVKLLLRSVEEFNNYRQKYPDRQIDLSGMDLSYTNLSGVNLSGANLSGADLSYTNLSGADLSRADLTGANLWKIQGLSEETREEVLKQLKKSWE